MTNKRMTKKDYFTAMIKFCEANPSTQFADAIDAEAMTSFAQHEIERLSKKRNSEGTVRKLTPEQKLNEQIKLEILDFLKDGQLHTITEMIKNVPLLVEMENVSPQKVSALLTQLGDRGTCEVEKEVIKRVTYFKRRGV